MQEEKHRNRLKLNLIAFVGFFVFSFSAFSQVPSTINFSVEDGLPSNETYDILEDYNGNLWICTDRGISRYDGTSFHNYNTSNSNLLCNTIFKAFYNEKNEIWFSGMDQSISIYEIDNDSFRHFSHNELLAKEWVFWSEGIVFHKNLVYLYPYSGGKNEERIAVYNPQNDSLIFKDKAQHFNIRTNFYTNSFDIGVPMQRRLYYSTEVEGQFASLPDEIENKKGNMRSIQRNAKQGEIYYFGVGGELSKFDGESLISVLQISSAINQVALNGQGRVSVLSDEGEFIVRGKEIIHRFQEYRLTGLCNDFEGNTWYTTLNKGIFFVPQSQTIRHKELVDKLPAKQIQLLKAFKQQLYLADYGKELYHVSEDGRIKSVPQKVTQTRPHRSDGFEFSFMHIENDTGFLPGSWILTVNDGVPHMELKGIPGLFRQVLPAKDGAMFYARFGGGYEILNRVQIDTLTDVTFERLDQHRDLISKKVLSVAKSKNYMWLGTEQGLWKVPFTNLDSAIQVYPDLLNVRINQILVDSNENILLATMGNGFNIIHEDTVLICGTQSGLPSNLVNGITIQNDTVIWVASTQGLSRVVYDGKVNFHVSRNMGASEGILANNITHLTICYDRLWLATSKDLYSIALHQVSSEVAAPFIKLYDCSYKGTSVMKADFLTNKQNSLRFSFLGISHRKPKENFYRYRLVKNGEEGEYIFTDAKEIQLTDLAPGRYVFQVAARSKENVWSEPAIHEFRIVPALTQTLGFKMGLVALLLIVVVMYFRRQERIRAEEANKEGKIKDLELNSLINQMNPHFVFNSMNSLQNLIVEEDLKTAINFIGGFSALMRSSLHFSGKEMISLDEELEFLTRYLNTELLRFPDRFTYKIDCDKELLNNDIQVPPLLLQPLIENSVKHAFVSQQGDGRIQVKITKQDDMIHLLLTDNGIGIKSGPTKLKNGKVDSKGTRIVEERMKIMKEKYPEHNIQFSITDLSDEPNNEKGTKVEILLPILD